MNWEQLWLVDLWSYPKWPPYILYSFHRECFPQYNHPSLHPRSYPTLYLLQLFIPINATPNHGLSRKWKGPPAEKIVQIWRWFGCFWASWVGLNLGEVGGRWWGSIIASWCSSIGGPIILPWSYICHLNSEASWYESIWDVSLKSNLSSENRNPFINRDRLQPFWIGKPLERAS